MKPLFACLFLLVICCARAENAAEDTRTQAYKSVQALIDAGKYPEAEQAARRLVVIRGNTRGPENFDTLRAKLILVGIFFALDQQAEAEALLKNLQSILKSAPAEEVREFLVSQGRHLRARMEQGHYGGAEIEFRSLIALEERVLGEENDDTLLTRSGRVTCLLELGKHAAAEKEQRAVLACRERANGPDDRVTLQARCSLATILIHEEKYAEAEAIVRDVIPVSVRRLGPEHSTTLYALSIFASVLVYNEKFGSSGIGV